MGPPSHATMPAGSRSPEPPASTSLLWWAHSQHCRELGGPQAFYSPKQAGGHSRGWGTGASTSGEGASPPWLPSASASVSAISGLS